MNGTYRNTILHRSTALLLGILLCVTAVQAQQVKTWTLDAEFDEGLLINVNHEVVSDQLQLNHESALLPYVNVAASDRGTVIRIDANTGDILGEYRTTPQGMTHNPSRTTVDRAGNVWAANRDQPVFPMNGDGSVLKIGVVLGGTRCEKNGLPSPTGNYLKPPFLYCTAVDRDGDGLIRTSRGLADIHGWSGGGVENAEDECILLYKIVPARNCRHISVDVENNVWVGGYSQQNITRSTMMKLNGQTGEIMQLHDGLECGGYGGLVSDNGTIFSSSLNGGGGPLLMMTPSGVASCLSEIQAYGLAEDPDGYIWATTYQSARLYKLDPAGNIQPGFPIDLNGTQVRGLAVTPDDGHVWIACTGTNTLERRDSDGALIREFALDAHTTPGEFPTGVAVDYNGRVWVTNAESDNVFRIDPLGDGGLGRIDMVVALGPDARPYNYSDMTGAAYGEYYPLYGTWSVLHDGGTVGMVWQQVTWTSSEPGDSRVLVKARAADSRDAIPAQEFRYLRSGALMCDSLLSGRFIQIFVEFHRGSAISNEPVLYDIELGGTERPLVGHSSAVICAGDSLRIQADPRFTQVRWNDGKGGAVRYIGTGGRYWYTARTPLGCTITSDTIDVEEHPAPQPELSADIIVKCIGEGVDISVTAPFARYRWEPGTSADTSRTLRVSAPGVYRVMVVDSNGCSGLSPAVLVEDYPLQQLRLAANGSTVLCHDGGVVRLEATAGFSRYRWSTGDSTAGRSLVVADTGTYSVSAIDSNGCTVFSNPVRVRRAPQSLLELALDGPQQRCEGDSVRLRATPGFVEYRWSTGESGQISSIPGGPTGLYWVTATDTNGCEARSDTVSLTVLPRPVAELRAAGDSVVCGDGHVRLEATPGFVSYEWSNGDLTDAPYLDVDESGVYSVMVLDSNGCSGRSNPVRVIFHPRPEVSLWMDGGFVLCKGQASTMHATPGFQRYRWSTGETGTMSSIAVTDSGRYWVEVTNEYGCRGSSDTVEVIVGDELLPRILADSDTLCPGGQVTLDAGPGYDRYNWSTGDSSQTTVVFRPGIYSVTVFSENGCSGDTTHVVYEEIPPAIIGARDTLCLGEERILDAGPGYASYQWNTGAQEQRITVSGSGRYTVDVLTTRGCVLSDTVDVYSFPLRPLTLDGARAVCPGSEVRYRVGGDSLSSVAWSLSSGGVVQLGSRPSEVTVRWQDIGTHLLTMRAILHPSGCPYDSVLQIVVANVVAPPIEGDPHLCPGAATRLHVGSHTGAALWLFPDGSRRADADTVETWQTGEHLFITSNAAGCADTSRVTVTALPLPDAIIEGPTVICAGESSAFTARGRYASHRWFTDAGSSTDDTLRLQSAGRVILETVSDQGCTARDTTYLHIQPLPQPVILGATVLAAGDSLELCLSNDWDSVSWYRANGSRLGEGRCVFVRDTGRYKVVVTDTTGCIGRALHHLRYADVQASATVALPVLTAEPGERIIIPVTLLASSNLEQLPLTRWITEIRFDARVLMPVASTPLGMLDGNDRVISLEGPIGEMRGTIAALEFLVMLGPVDETALHFDTFRWEGGAVETEQRHGELRVGICTEGGNRLFDARRVLRLEANRPNPFNSSTVITFEIIEAGHTEVFVTDQVGRRVAQLQQGVLQPGVYSLLFDGRLLPSGLYFCILRTPTQQRVRRMQLIK